MQRHAIRNSLFATLLFTTACSQPPAQVENKGQNTYGRSSYASIIPPSTPTPLYSYNSHTAPAPAPYTTVAGNTQASAGIQPIGVHDLSALSPASGATASQNTNPVNPWTGKPHFTTADNSPPSQAPVTQLDRVISNSGSAPAPAAKPKQVAKAENAFMWPVSGKKIISGFGPKGDGKVNDGINIAAGEGEPVWASADGEIVYVGNELAGYGNMVLIKHSGNKTTAYAHLSRATVDKYERVKQGDIIGYVGTTGNVKEPQLHFAIRDGKEPVDPAKYLSRNVASN